jgi:hypothetical protein
MEVSSEKYVRIREISPETGEKRAVPNHRLEAAPVGIGDGIGVGISNPSVNGIA